METSRLEVAAYLLPFFLALLAIAGLMRLPALSRSAAWSKLRRHWKAAALIVAVLVFLIVDLPFLLDRAFDITSPGWRFWLATVAGNWAPDSFPGFAATPAAAPALAGAERVWFVASAGLAFWINNLIVLALLGWVWRLVVERRKAMNLSTALRLKDSFARTAVQDLLEDRFAESERQRFLQLFDDAMIQAQQDLEKHLPKIDPETGPEILASLRPEARTGRRRPASAA